MCIGAELSHIKKCEYIEFSLEVPFRLPVNIHKQHTASNSLVSYALLYSPVEKCRGRKNFYETKNHLNIFASYLPSIKEQIIKCPTK
ncbi:hypothetical protein XELAEV_18024982mg [Xenopus laevis]|uniref:Uncharacterized protein n=1 Tax=Xenopus laevis TaxID=8355 RepID=A0A974D198_XENLA|nr:hypothetical protein XELAEV_18024982mg [Xenopus laevis]